MYITEARKINSWKWRGRELEWEDFVHRVEEKFIRTPETMAEYAAMSKDDRDSIKAMPGCFVGARLNSGRRLLQSVVSRTCITLDGDYATAKDWDNFTCIHDDLAVICYPTHSSRPNKPRRRWVMPISRELTPDESAAVARRVAEWIGIETMDATTFDLNRAMYYPSVPKDAPYELKVQWGNPINVDEVLSSYGDGEAWRDASLWPASSRERELPRAGGGKQAENPTEKHGIVGLFCRTYDVEDAINEFIPDVYAETATPGRYTYTKGSTSGGAIVYDDGAFLYSNHATDPAGGRSVNAFDLVRIHKFGHLDEDKAEDTPVTKLPSFSAMSEWAAALPAVKRQLVAERNAETEEAFGDMVGGNDDADGDDDVADDEANDDLTWTDALELIPKSTELRATINNVSLILRGDPRLKGHVCYNEFTRRRCAVDPLPWTPHSEGIRNWTDADDASLRKYIEKAWRIYNAKGVIDDAVRDSENTTKRHPVREYLNALQWDGTPRLETMLIRHLKAPDTLLNRAIARHWMLAACARVFHPGIKFDPVLVLVTNTQGVGKSLFGQILAGQLDGTTWFQDGLPPIDSKDAKQALRGKWIVEVGEMAATRKADDEAIKQFFACDTDSYRESYGRYSEDYKRQCVFLGTTNSREFIFDPTGGRRFWPVDVEANASDTRERMAALREERDQLWAEAMTYYHASVKKGTLNNDVWISDPTLTAELGAEQEKHTQDDEWVSWVDAFLDRPLPDDWDTLSMQERRDVMRGMSIRYPEDARKSWTKLRQTVCIAEIRNELLGDDLSSGAGGNHPNSRHLGRVMNVLAKKWRVDGKMKPDFPYGRQKKYRRVGEEKV